MVPNCYVHILCAGEQQTLSALLLGQMLRVLMQVFKMHILMFQ